MWKSTIRKSKEATERRLQVRTQGNVQNDLKILISELFEVIHHFQTDCCTLKCQYNFDILSEKYLRQYCRML